MQFAKRTALLLAAVMLTACLAGPAVLASEENPRPDLIPGRGLLVEENEDLGPLLVGLQAKTADNPVPMDVIMCFDVPGDWTCVVQDKAGEDISISEAPIATGDQVVFTDPDQIPETLTVVVRGDVLGNGTMSIVQLTAMARSLTGQNPLTGPYALAGDLNGSGSPDIADLTLEAWLLQTGGADDLSPVGYPSMVSVAEAAYLLNPRDGAGPVYIEDGKVHGPLAETVLHSLIDLHAKLTDPEAPRTGLLGDPEHFHPLLLDVLTTCRVEPVDSGTVEYRFDAPSILTLLEALFGVDCSAELRRGVEQMEGDAFWQDDYIELSGTPVGESVVTYTGIGQYPSPTDAYEFRSIVTLDGEDGEEYEATMTYTIRILPDEISQFGFLVESCEMTGAAG